MCPSLSRSNILNADFSCYLLKSQVATEAKVTNQLNVMCPDPSKSTVLNICSTIKSAYTPQIFLKAMRSYWKLMAPSLLVSISQNYCFKRYISLGAQIKLRIQLTTMTWRRFSLRNYLSRRKVSYKLTCWSYLEILFLIQLCSRHQAAVKRFDTSFYSSLKIKSLPYCETLFHTPDLNVAYPFLIIWTVQFKLEPLKGMRPLSMTQTRTPKLHMSHSKLQHPFKTQGAQYYGVPHLRYRSPQANTPSPQSITLIIYSVPAFLTKIFQALMSL